MTQQQDWQEPLVASSKQKQVDSAKVSEGSHVRIAGKPKTEISCANTTLIGDYTSVVFLPMDTKWLVQAQDNATFSSTLALVNDGMIAVGRRYIFIQLGGNQVRFAEKPKIYSWVLDLVVKIRERNPTCKIFFLGVLPRLVDNEDIKPYIMKFSRWLSVAVHEVNIIFKRIQFLPIHLRFIEGNIPKAHLFEQDNQLLLNVAGQLCFVKWYFN